MVPFGRLAIVGRRGAGSLPVPFTLGQQNFDTTATASTDRVRLLKLTPGQNLSIEKIWFRSGETDVNADQRAVVYSDSGGAAATLLAISAVNEGISNGVDYGLDLTSPLLVSSGVPIWIGFHFGSSTSTIWVDDTGTNFPCRTSNTDTFSDGSAGTYVGDFSTPTRDWCFWATGMTA